jgi:hypothetical protein
MVIANISNWSKYSFAFVLLGEHFQEPASRHFMEIRIWTISWTLTLRPSHIKPLTMIQFSLLCEVLGPALCFCGSSFSAIKTLWNLLHHTDTSFQPKTFWLLTLTDLAKNLTLTHSYFRSVQSLNLE